MHAVQAVWSRGQEQLLFGSLCCIKGKKSRFQSHVRGIEAENSRTLRLSILSSGESGPIAFYFLPDYIRSYEIPVADFRKMTQVTKGKEN